MLEVVGHSGTFCLLFYGYCAFGRGVPVHKHDGSVRTSVLTSWFGMVSVQQRKKITYNCFFIKQWLTEQIALS